MKLNHYIHTQLTLSFFTIFFGLFFITSNVFLVKIASLTSVVTINFLELITLFSYSLPSILFYTLPISFFIALLVALAKLSSEYELIVITSFGLDPKKMLNIIFPITFIISASLLIISLELIPKTKFLTDQMIDFKKREANFNIKASEYGQKFDEWLIYISAEKEGLYKDLRLLKVEDDKSEFIIAKTATLKNDKGKLSFELNNGKAYSIKNSEITQINFDKMIIAENLQNSNYENFSNSFNYWFTRISLGVDLDKFAFSILVSLFPLISLYLVLAFSYYNPRYEKNHSIGFGVLSVIVFFIISDWATKNIFLHSIYLIPIIWLVSSYYIFKTKTKKTY